MVQSIPYGFGTLQMPSFPWTPQVVEELVEQERKAYLGIARSTREMILKKQ